jgi:cell division protein FtsA
MAGIEIDSVYLALSGPHVKGFKQRGVIAVAGRIAKCATTCGGRSRGQVVRCPRTGFLQLPQDFVVDEQDGIGAPIGMTGARSGQRGRRHRRGVVRQNIVA